MWPPFELAAAAAVAIARGRASCVQFVRMSRGFSSGWGNAGDRAGERPRVGRRVGGFPNGFPIGFEAGCWEQQNGKISQFRALPKKT